MCIITNWASLQPPSVTDGTSRSVLFSNCPCHATVVFTPKPRRGYSSEFSSRLCHRLMRSVPTQARAHIHMNCSENSFDVLLNNPIIPESVCSDGFTDRRRYDKCYQQTGPKLKFGTKKQDVSCVQMFRMTQIVPQSLQLHFIMVFALAPEPQKDLTK